VIELTRGDSQRAAIDNYVDGVGCDPIAAAPDVRVLYFDAAEAEMRRPQPNRIETEVARGSLST